jgi:hypothetical protein
MPRGSWRLVRFFEHDVNQPAERGGVAPANLPDYNQNHVFTGIAHVGTLGMNLTGAGAPERIFGTQASYNFLDVLGVQPAMGRGFLPEEDRYGARRVVVITRRPAWNHWPLRNARCRAVRNYRRAAVRLPVSRGD